MKNDFKKLLELLQTAQDKYALDAAVYFLLEIIDRNSNQVDSISYQKEITELFMEKIFNFIFSKGDITDKVYLNLYILFKNAPINTQFEKIEKIGLDSLFGEGVSDNENVMLIELVMLTRILGGRAQEGLDFYLQNIMLVDIHCMEAQKNIEIMLKFFNIFKIPFEEFARNLGVILSQRFSALNAKQKRSVFNWQLHVFWNIKHYFNHRKWLDFYPLYKDIFYKELDITDSIKIDFALYLQFFIYHICGNNFSTQEQWNKFNTEISVYACKIYEKFGQSFSLPKGFENHSGVIGILRDRLVENSPYKVEYSFLKTLLTDKKFTRCYKVKIYLMSLLEKSDDDEEIKKSYRDLGIDVVDILGEYNKAVYYNSHLTKALVLRERILKDQVEFLISPNNGYGISDFLLATRVCTKQFFWSHGNFVYDIPFLDTKITHICNNQSHIKHCGHLFVGISVKMDNSFYNPEVPELYIRQARAHYPSDVKILGNMGRLTKIDSLEFLQVVIEILLANPKSIFLACGSGNIEEIKKKILKINSNLLARFYFPGFVDSRIFGHVIDIWLDSFPMQQGESRIEYAAKGRPTLILTQETREARRHRLEEYFFKNKKIFSKVLEKNNIGLEVMRHFICQEESFVAFDEQDYIQKAKELITMSQEVLEQKMQLQNLLKDVGDILKEEQGKKTFLELLHL